jgi:hypothetical protein
MTNPNAAAGADTDVITIGEIFDIPRQVHQGDFVLKLTEGVDERHAAGTLRDYVVTDQLVDCFKQALGLVGGALQAGTSRAAYLHGSFGAGKSHFMAVLSLLLDGDTRARAVPELAPVVAANRDWLGQQRVLVVPMHLIGAPSLEAAVLGQYARYVRERHPQAPTPGFYRGERLFHDARALRASMGDTSFFAKLGESSSGDDGWGALGSGWDAASFDAAVTAPAGDPERARLVGDLVDAFFTAAADLAGTHDEGFLPIDEGLVVLTRHAQSLGYEAVVLFLDEVMLWLASNAADQRFLSNEAQKLAKLVEAAQMQRPIPIVSFLARQRDLRELVGEHLVGAEQQAISDVLRWWEGRFDTIRLEDRNLPAIIERRLLRPVDAAARAKVEEAHARTESIRADVLSVLLTREGDRASFKQVYPFSPVLVQALVALSALLQRERTALKLLVQLLVKQRDVLPLGDIMPVGELWSVLEDGAEQPFSAALRERFAQARRLWRNKLVPMLEEERETGLGSGMTPELADATFRNDQRLLATLILAALAEGVEALDQLTPQKLAALNHGTIRSRIPGQEARVVLDKLRRWAGRVGEIRFTENGATPTVSLHLVGVDTEIILENARAADTPGARIQKVRSILFELAGIPSEDALTLPVRAVPWRGTTRQVEVLFRNVRGMAPEQFRPSGEAPWRLVVDYPFDEGTWTPRDDLATFLEAQRLGGEVQSIVWLPAFLSTSTQDELGKLVLLDHVLSGNQLDAHASHLSAQDRAQARELLRNQQTAVRTNTVNALLAAYGVTQQFRDKIDTTHGLDTHLYTLAAGLTLQPPVGATFSEALNHVVGQALAWQYPAHPTFEAELRLPTLRKVWGWVQKGAQQPNGRVEVDRADREDMRRFAVPLDLGQMGDAHFVLERKWEAHFAQCNARDAVTPLTVQRVRRWLDEPRARGLAREAQNLVILTWGLQTDRSFHLAGSTTVVDGALDRLSDDLEIRTQALPEERAWASAVRRAAELLGITVPSHRSAHAVAMLAAAVKEKVTASRPGVVRYVQQLDAALPRADVESQTSDRRTTANAARDLLTALQDERPDGVVRALADVLVPTSATALGEAVTRGADLAQAIERVQWTLVQNVATLPRETFGTRADALLDGIRDALRRDEHVVSLAAAVARFNDDGLRLLTEAAQLARELEDRRRADEERQRELERELARRVAELERREAEQRERERREAEQKARERDEAERQERERLEALKKERERPEPEPAEVTKSKTVPGAHVESVIAELRNDVASSGDAEVEVTWRIRRHTRV